MEHPLCSGLKTSKCMMDPKTLLFSLVCSQKSPVGSIPKSSLAPSLRLSGAWEERKQESQAVIFQQPNIFLKDCYNHWSGLSFKPTWTKCSFLFPTNHKENEDRTVVDKIKQRNCFLLCCSSDQNVSNSGISVTSIQVD